MKKDLNIVLLLDFYGAVLKDRQREIMELYYNEDLSLAEIAENTGITRQGVFDAVKKAETVLSELEMKLCLIQRFHDADGKLKYAAGSLEGILKRIDSLSKDNIKEIIVDSINKIHEIEI